MKRLLQILTIPFVFVNAEVNTIKNKLQMMTAHNPLSPKNWNAYDKSFLNSVYFFLYSVPTLPSSSQVSVTVVLLNMMWVKAMDSIWRAG